MNSTALRVIYTTGIAEEGKKVHLSTLSTQQQLTTTNNNNNNNNNSSSSSSSLEQQQRQQEQLQPSLTSTENKNVSIQYIFSRKLFCLLLNLIPQANGPLLVHYRWLLAISFQKHGLPCRIMLCLRWCPLTRAPRWIHQKLLR